MSRYIDADNILYEDLSEGRGVCWVTFEDWIKEMPTADVVEVVRCKDCKFYTFKPQQTSRTTSVRRCNRSAIVCTKPDDYCSFGERAKE